MKIEDKYKWTDKTELTCSICKGLLEKIPVKQEFLRFKDFKVLVEIRGDGKVIPKLLNPQYKYACNHCHIMYRI